MTGTCPVGTTETAGGELVDVHVAEIAIHDVRATQHARKRATGTQRDAKRKTADPTLVVSRARCRQNGDCTHRRTPTHTGTDAQTHAARVHTHTCLRLYPYIGV